MNVSPINIAEVSKARRFVRSFATRSWIPLLLTEACVEAGRTYQAYKRGGFTEARERITEEFTSAVVWMGGVPFFDMLIDKFVGKGILKLPGDGFSVGKDAARNPVANYIHKFFKDKSPEQVESLLGKYRFGKLAVSLGLATLAVGVAVPKINQAITRKMRRNQASQEQAPATVQNDSAKTQTNNQFAPVSMDGFLNGKKSKDLAFTGAMTGAKLMNIVNTFETTPKYQLLTEDGGVLVGRTSNARNKFEAIEIGFRDGASCYFYMFNTPIMAGMLNKVMGGSKIDPVASEAATRHFIQMVKENGGQMSADAFKKAALGDAAKRYLMTPELEREIVSNGGHVELESFLRQFKGVVDENAAREMSKLQPQLKGTSILTKQQVKDLFTGGKINSPEFMHDMYRVQTTPDTLFKVGKPAYSDPVGYVKLAELEGTKKHAQSYVDDIVKSAKKKGQEITEELLKNANKKALYKQAFAWGTGFAVSILFLSTLIPKAQYWITRKLTGSDAFPGTAEYNKNKKA